MLGAVALTPHLRMSSRELERAPGDDYWKVRMLFSQAHRFVGEYHDPGSGLYHLRARDYDVATGRFLGLDALDAAIGSSYAYADDRPTLLTDPTGGRPILGTTLGQVTTPVIPIPLPPIIDRFPTWLRPWWADLFEGPRDAPRRVKSFDDGSGCRAQSDNPHQSRHAAGRIAAAGRTICPVERAPYLKVLQESTLYRSQIGISWRKKDHSKRVIEKRKGREMHYVTVVSTPCARAPANYRVETQHTVISGSGSSPSIRWTSNTRKHVICLPRS